MGFLDNFFSNKKENSQKTNKTKNPPKDVNITPAQTSSLQPVRPPSSNPIFGSLRKFKSGVAITKKDTDSDKTKNTDKKNNTQRDKSKKAGTEIKSDAAEPTVDNVDSVSPSASTSKTTDAHVTLRRRGKENVEQHFKGVEKKDKTKEIVPLSRANEGFKRDRIKSSTLSLNLIRAQPKLIRTQQTKPKRPITVSAPNISVRRGHKEGQGHPDSISRTSSVTNLDSLEANLQGQQGKGAKPRKSSSKERIDKQVQDGKKISKNNNKLEPPVPSLSYSSDSLQEAEIQHLRKQLKEMSDEKSSLALQLGEQRGQLNVLQKEIQKLKTFQEESSLEMDKLAEENTALRNRLRDVAHSPLSDNEKQQLLFESRHHNSAPASIATNIADDGGDATTCTTPDWDKHSSSNVSEVSVACLQDKINQMQETHYSTNEELQATLQELTDLQRQLTELQQENERLNEEKTLMFDSLCRQTERLNDSRQEVENLKQLLYRDRSDETGVNQLESVVEREQKLVELLRSAQEEREQLLLKLEQIQAELQDTRTGNIEKSDAIVQLSERVKTLECSLDAKHAEHKQLDQELAQAKDQCSGKQIEINRLTDLLENARTKINELEQDRTLSDKSELDEMLDNARKEKDQLESEVAYLKEQLARSKNEIEKLKEQVFMLQEECKVTRNNAKTTQSDLEYKCEKLVTEKNNLGDQLQQFQEAVNELQVQAQCHLEDKRQLSSVLSETQRNLSEAERRNLNLETEIQELKKLREEENDEWEKFQNDLLTSVRVANDFKTEAQQELQKIILENKTYRERLRLLEGQVEKLKGGKRLASTQTDIILTPQLISLAKNLDPSIPNRLSLLEHSVSPGSVSPTIPVNEMEKLFPILSKERRSKSKENLAEYAYTSKTPFLQSRIRGNLSSVNDSKKLVSKIDESEETVESLEEPRNNNKKMFKRTKSKDNLVTTTLELPTRVNESTNKGKKSSLTRHTSKDNLDQLTEGDTSRSKRDDSSKKCVSIVDKPRKSKDSDSSSSSKSDSRPELFSKFIKKRDKKVSSHRKTMSVEEEILLKSLDSWYENIDHNIPDELLSKEDRAVKKLKILFDADQLKERPVAHKPKEQLAISKPLLNSVVENPQLEEIVRNPRVPTVEAQVRESALEAACDVDNEVKQDGLGFRVKSEEDIYTNIGPASLGLHKSHSLDDLNLFEEYRTESELVPVLFRTVEAENLTIENNSAIRIEERYHSLSSEIYPIDSASNPRYSTKYNNAFSSKIVPNNLPKPHININYENLDEIVSKISEDIPYNKLTVEQKCALELKQALNDAEKKKTLKKIKRKKFFKGLDITVPTQESVENNWKLKEIMLNPRIKKAKEVKQDKFFLGLFDEACRKRHSTDLGNLNEVPKITHDFKSDNLMSKSYEDISFSFVPENTLLKLHYSENNGFAEKRNATSDSSSCSLSFTSADFNLDTGKIVKKFDAPPHFQQKNNEDHQNVIDHEDLLYNETINKEKNKKKSKQKQVENSYNADLETLKQELSEPVTKTVSDPQLTRAQNYQIDKDMDPKLKDSFERYNKQLKVMVKRIETDELRRSLRKPVYTTSVVETYYQTAKVAEEAHDYNLLLRTNEHNKTSPSSDIVEPTKQRSSEIQSDISGFKTNKMKNLGEIEGSLQEHLHRSIIIETHHQSAMLDTINDNKVSQATRAEDASTSIDSSNSEKLEVVSDSENLNINSAIEDINIESNNEIVICKNDKVPFVFPNDIVSFLEHERSFCDTSVFDKQSDLRNPEKISYIFNSRESVENEFGINSTGLSYYKQSRNSGLDFIDVSKTEINVQEAVNDQLSYLTNNGIGSEVDNSRSNPIVQFNNDNVHEVDSESLVKNVPNFEISQVDNTSQSTLEEVIVLDTNQNNVDEADQTGHLETVLSNDPSNLRNVKTINTSIISTSERSRSISVTNLLSESKNVAEIADTKKKTDDLSKIIHENIGYQSPLEPTGFVSSAEIDEMYDDESNYKDSDKMLDDEMSRIGLEDTASTQQHDEYYCESVNMDTKNGRNYDYQAFLKENQYGVVSPMDLRYTYRGVVREYKKKFPLENHEKLMKTNDDEESHLEFNEHFFDDFFKPIKHDFCMNHQVIDIREAKTEEPPLVPDSEQQREVFTDENVDLRKKEDAVLQIDKEMQEIMERYLHTRTSVIVKTTGVNRQDEEKHLESRSNLRKYDNFENLHQIDNATLENKDDDTHLKVESTATIVEGESTENEPLSKEELKFIEEMKQKYASQENIAAKSLSQPIITDKEIEHKYENLTEEQLLLLRSAKNHISRPMSDMSDINERDLLLIEEISKKYSKDGSASSSVRSSLHEEKTYSQIMDQVSNDTTDNKISVISLQDNEIEVIPPLPLTPAPTTFHNNAQSIQNSSDWHCMSPGNVNSTKYQNKQPIMKLVPETNEIESITGNVEENYHPRKLENKEITFPSLSHSLIPRKTNSKQSAFTYKTPCNVIFRGKTNQESVSSPPNTSVDRLSTNRLSDLMFKETIFVPVSKLEHLSSSTKFPQTSKPKQPVIVPNPRKLLSVHVNAPIPVLKSATDLSFKETLFVPLEPNKKIDPDIPMDNSSLYNQHTEYSTQKNIGEVDIVLVSKNENDFVTAESSSLPVQKTVEDNSTIGLPCGKTNHLNFKETIFVPFKSESQKDLKVEKKKSEYSTEESIIIPVKQKSNIPVLEKVVIPKEPSSRTEPKSRIPTSNKPGYQSYKETIIIPKKQEPLGSRHQFPETSNLQQNRNVPGIKVNLNRYSAIPQSVSNNSTSSTSGRSLSEPFRARSLNVDQLNYEPVYQNVTLRTRSYKSGLSSDNIKPPLPMPRSVGSFITNHLDGGTISKIDHVIHKNVIMTDSKENFSETLANTEVDTLQTSKASNIVKLQSKFASGAVLNDYNESYLINSEPKPNNKLKSEFEKNVPSEPAISVEESKAETDILKNKRVLVEEIKEPEEHLKPDENNDLANEVSESLNTSVMARFTPNDEHSAATGSSSNKSEASIIVTTKDEMLDITKEKISADPIIEEVEEVERKPSDFDHSTVNLFKMDSHSSYDSYLELFKSKESKDFDDLRGKKLPGHNFFGMAGFAYVQELSSEDLSSFNSRDDVISKDSRPKVVDFVPLDDDTTPVFTKEDKASYDTLEREKTFHVLSQASKIRSKESKETLNSQKIQEDGNTNSPNDSTQKKVEDTDLDSSLEILARKSSSFSKASSKSQTNTSRTSFTQAKKLFEALVEANKDEIPRGMPSNQTVLKHGAKESGSCEKIKTQASSDKDEEVKALGESGLMVQETKQE